MNAPEQRLAAATTGPASASDRLGAAPSREVLSSQWLVWLSELLPGLRRSFVLLDAGNGSLTTAAVRPEGVNPELARALVTRAATQRSMVTEAGSQGQQFAFPLLLAERVRAIVFIELAGFEPTALGRVSTLVQWGLGWLGQALADPAAAGNQARLARARQAIDSALTVMAEPGFRGSAMALVNLLNRQFDAQMVQLGWIKGRSAEVVARSQTAWHDGRTQLMQLAEQAMNEALDQGQTLSLPAPPEPRLAALRAQDAYRRAANADALLTVPLRAHGELVGALMFERSRPFDEAEVDAAEALTLMLAPLMQLRRQADESVARHLRRKAGTWSGWLTGTRHLGWKLLGTGAALLLVLAAVLPVPHRVTAPAVVEGELQRSAVAPFNGFIRSSHVRAGDTVKAGQLLARLDDKDLNLERVRWETELEVSLRKEREAMAAADRVAMRLAAAQAAQAQAQLDLVLAKLARVDILAPFDAVVVRGDLSQMLGSPVESGKTLFELAPLSAWRVIVKVDERDVASVAPGQHGELVLASLPGKSFELTAQRVLSVAVAEEGRNYFRVEAGLGPEAARLRPGMEGVAKLTVGEAPLLWVWTHRATDWLRRTAWEWTP